MKPNYKLFKNRLHISENFVTNNPTVIEVMTQREKDGKKDLSTPFRPLSNFLNRKQWKN